MAHLYDLALFEGKLLYCGVRVRGHGLGVVVKQSYKNPRQVVRLRLLEVVRRASIPSSVTA